MNLKFWKSEDENPRLRSNWVSRITRDIAVVTIAGVTAYFRFDEWKILATFVASTLGISLSEAYEWLAKRSDEKRFAEFNAALNEETFERLFPQIQNSLREHLSKSSLEFDGRMDQFESKILDMFQEHIQQQNQQNQPDIQPKVPRKKAVNL